MTNNEDETDWSDLTDWADGIDWNEPKEIPLKELIRVLKFFGISLNISISDDKSSSS